MIDTSDIRNGYQEPFNVVPADVKIDCSQDEQAPRGVTRQEFKDEADINNIIARFLSTGVPPAQRQPVYGDRDFDMDLHTGYIAIENSQRAFLRLPQALQDKYKTPAGLLDALHRGEFKDDLLAERTAELDRQEAQAARSGEAAPPPA